MSSGIRKDLAKGPRDGSRPSECKSCEVLCSISGLREQKDDPGLP